MTQSIPTKSWADLCDEEDNSSTYLDARDVNTTSTRVVQDGYCLVCKVNVSDNSFDIIKHIQGKRHRKNTGKNPKKRIRKIKPTYRSKINKSASSAGLSMDLTASDLPPFASTFECIYQSNGKIVGFKCNGKIFGQETSLVVPFTAVPLIQTSIILNFRAVLGLRFAALPSLVKIPEALV